MATMTLSKARKAKGLTAYALAQAVGVNRSTISRLERGLRLPMHDTAVRLEKVLGCDLKFSARRVSA